MFIIRLKNATKKLQQGSKVNYVKTFFIECVSIQTQQTSTDKI